MNAPIKDMNRQFIREEIQITSKYEKCSDLLAIKEMSIKKTSYFFPFKLRTVKMIKWPVLVWWYAGTLISYTFGRVYIDTTFLGDSFVHMWMNYFKNLYTVCVSNSTQSDSCKNLCVWIFTSWHYIKNFKSRNWSRVKWIMTYLWTIKNQMKSLEISYGLQSFHVWLMERWWYRSMKERRAQMQRGTSKEEHQVPRRALTRFWALGNCLGFPQFLRGKHPH